MSRLDDELKVAFRRQEPSADFADRVLARLAVQPQPPPKRGFWRALLDFFQPNTLRWAFAAAAVLLIAAIAVVQYQRSSKPGDTQQAVAPPVQKQEPVVATPAAPTVAQDGKQKVAHEGLKQEAAKPQPRRHQSVRHQVAARHKQMGTTNQNTNHGTLVAAAAKSPGEIAKEQLMKALAITSTLINEAKDVAIGGKE